MAFKILVVDDSVFQRKVVGKSLVKAGHEVEFASNGKEGVEKAKEGKFDGIVSDLLMPDFDGYYLLEQVKNENLNIPVVILTANIQETAVEQARELGAREVLNKPPKDGELSSTVDQHFSG